MIADTIIFDTDVADLDNPWATILLVGYRLRFRIMHYGNLRSGSHMGCTDVSVVDAEGQEVDWPDNLDPMAVVYTISSMLPPHWPSPQRFPERGAPGRNAVGDGQAETAGRQGAVPL